MQELIEIHLGDNNIQSTITKLPWIKPEIETIEISPHVRGGFDLLESHCGALYS